MVNTYLECRFASGAMAHLNFCPVTGVLIERATVTLHDHTFFLDTPLWNAFDAPGRLVHVRRGEIVRQVDGGSLPDADQMYVASGFFGENAAFLDDLRAGRRPAGDIRSGLQAVEVAECMRLRKSEYVAG